MRNAVIRSTGAYIPETSIPNSEFDKRFGEGTGNRVVEKTGIKARRHMRADQTTSDLVVEAAKEALTRAKLTAADLDLILIATDTPDQPSPATASVVQHKLQASKAGTFDLNSACAGFVAGLDVASKFIQADPTYQHILVVGAYGMSRFLDWTDKTTATLFADGAGAAIVSAVEGPTKTGYLGGVLASDGSYHDALGIYAGGASKPAGGDVHQYVKFVRRFPPTFNVERWPMLLKNAADKAGEKLEDVDLFIFTQLNLRVIESVMQVMKFPMSKTHYTMEEWGYLGSGAIPSTLHDAVLKGRVKKGDLVALCASGGGISMGASLFRWTAETVA